MPNKVGKSGKQNRLAGKHPSYKGMSKEQIERKKKYDSEYQKSESRVQYRVELNKENNKRKKSGSQKVGDKSDISHSITQDGKKVFTSESQKSNRARNKHDGKSTLRKVGKKK